MGFSAVFFWFYLNLLQPASGEGSGFNNLVHQSGCMFAATSTVCIAAIAWSHSPGMVKLGIQTLISLLMLEERRFLLHFSSSYKLCLNCSLAQLVKVEHRLVLLGSVALCAAAIGESVVSLSSLQKAD